MASPQRSSSSRTKSLVSIEPAADTDTGSTLASAVQPVGSAADTAIYYIFYRNTSSSSTTMAQPTSTADPISGPIGSMDRTTYNFATTATAASRSLASAINTYLDSIVGTSHAAQNHLRYTTATGAHLHEFLHNLQHDT